MNARSCKREGGEEYGERERKGAEMRGCEWEPTMYVPYIVYAPSFLWKGRRDGVGRR